MTASSDRTSGSTRRTFLKAAAATGAGVTLGALFRGYALDRDLFGERWSSGPGTETWRLGLCRQCGAGCSVRVRLVNGDARNLRGNPLCPLARGTLCPKGQAALQALYNPDRLVGPVRRVGGRGEGRWERISWSDAQTEIAGKLGALRQAGRPEALVWLAERDDATQGQLLRRFVRAYGSPNYFEFVGTRDSSARGAMRSCQGVDEFPVYDLENANFVLSFSTPLLESWMAPAWVARQYGHLHRGRPERRGRFVQIEPRLSPTAVKADQWIPIRPGTEAHLALAIAHVLIREDLYDRAFVQEHAFGFSDWTDAAGNEHEGFRAKVLRDFAPGDIAAVTGVPVTTILRLARELSGGKPSVAVGERAPLSGGLGLAWAVHTLNALNGMVDREGGVLTQRALPLKPFPEAVLDEPARAGLARPPLAAAAGFSGIGEALGAGASSPVEALFLSSARFLSVSPGREKFLQAVEQIPWVVSFSTALDDTAAFADLILPDHSPLEKWHDSAPLPISGAPLWAVAQPALEPLFDTRHTAEVVMDLGRSLGGPLAQAFPWSTAPEVLRFAAQGLFETRRGLPYATADEGAWMKQLEAAGWWAPSARSFEEFWDQLLRAGGWFDPLYSYEQWQRALRTPTGRFEFTSSTFPAPKIEQPQWAGDAEAFPLKLNVFTTLATGGLEDPNQPFLQEALGPHVHARWDAWVELNPQTAHALGIDNGSWVWLESPQGKVRLRAYAFPGALPDVASALIGHEHRDGGRYVTKRPAAVADLVAYRADEAGTALAATTRVKIYKARGT
jgi:menaquinone reductase, molybdopterin-binding-like subunit